MDETKLSILKKTGSTDVQELVRAIRGTTVIYSKVLRAGRTREGQRFKVRIFIGGRAHEIAFRGDDRVRDELLRLVKDDRVVPIKVDATWRVDGERHVLDLGRSAVVGVDATWTPVSGSDFVHEMRGAVGVAFANLDEVEDLLGIERGAAGDTKCTCGYDEYCL